MAGIKSIGQRWAQLQVGQKVFGFGSLKNDDYEGTVVKLTETKMVVKPEFWGRKTFTLNHEHDKDSVRRWHRPLLFVTYKRGRTLVCTAFEIIADASGKLAKKAGA
jgi:hypothetical protein